MKLKKLIKMLKSFGPDLTIVEVTIKYESAKMPGWLMTVEPTIKVKK